MPQAGPAGSRAERFLRRPALEALRGPAGAHREDPRRGGDGSVRAGARPRRSPVRARARRRPAAPAHRAEPRGADGPRQPARRDGPAEGSVAERRAADRRRRLAARRPRGAEPGPRPRRAREVPGLRAGRGAAALLPGGRPLRLAHARARGLRARHRGGARLRDACARHSGRRDSRDPASLVSLPRVPRHDARGDGGGSRALPREQGARSGRVRASAQLVPRTRGASLHLGARDRGARGRAPVCGGRGARGQAGRHAPETLRD